MKWMDTLRSIATAMDLERPAGPQGQPPAGWDPYDVWLTRIHRPRMARIDWMMPRPRGTQAGAPSTPTMSPVLDASRSGRIAR